MQKIHRMDSRVRTLTILLGLMSVVMGFSACAEVSLEPTGNEMPVTAQSSEGWLVLPELPSIATQADVGAEIYRLVCQDCHGNQGQGLTDEWRAEWSPEDQNCWQSKCHASNHPPEGFVLPRQVRALVGAGTLVAHETVLDLHSYTRNRMPGTIPEVFKRWSTGSSQHS